MSFRKRSDVIGGTPAPGGRTSVPGRTPGIARPLGSVPGRGVPVGRKVPNQSDKAQELQTNPGIKPSIITSQPTVSTGTADLDKILQHQGLPLGCSLLIEESGTTDFSSVLLRNMASQGVMHNRINKDEYNSHVILVGPANEWANQLPGLYKGSSKEKKKALISSNESEISVNNLAQSAGASNPRLDQDLKIAWRYGLNKKPEAQNEAEKTFDHYNYQFDLTERLKPAPSHLDMSFVKVVSDFNTIILQITGIIKQQLKSNPSKTIRVIIPSLLIPSIYSPEHSRTTFIIPFVHCLRSLLRQYSNNVVLIASIPLDLYPRDTMLTSQIEQLVDACIHLQPFNQEMSQFIEKAYKNEPGKVQHGLVNIIKLPVLNDRGVMTRHDGEYAFKNGRKKFEIEEWGIPVEDDSNDNQDKQTTKDVEF